MGILDDAIREHLELKRQHGAESEDLERLEKEAFGPATRPGDPEFADPDASVSEAPEAGNGAPPEAPAEEEGSAGFSDWFAGEEATTVAPAAPAAEEPPSAELPVAEEAPSAEQPLAEEPSAAPEPEPTPAEQARVEHANLGETADHPAPTQLGPEDEAERAPDDAPPPADEPPPPEPPESGIFDAGDEEEEGDEPEPDSLEEPLPPAPPRDVAPASPTTDHDLPPAPVSRPAPEEEDSGEAEKSAEDLLEETPDFLQETEGEDLWFEQGPPKDFDFDDNDD